MTKTASVQKGRPYSPFWRTGLDSSISVRAGLAWTSILFACALFSKGLDAWVGLDAPGPLKLAVVLTLSITLVPLQLVAFVIVLRFIGARIVMHRVIRRRKPFGRLAQ
ncbi:MAG: hypothetical protein AAGI53_07415 [Planctomycetota bacterium]